MIKTNKTIEGVITELKYKVNVNSSSMKAQEILKLNEVGLVNIKLGEPIGFDAYKNNKVMGSFIIIDKFTNNIVPAA